MNSNFEKEFAAYEAKRDAAAVEGEYGHGNWVVYSEGIAYHYPTARKAKEFANGVSCENGGKPVEIYQAAAGSDVLHTAAKTVALTPFNSSVTLVEVVR